MHFGFCDFLVILLTQARYLLLCIAAAVNQTYNIALPFLNKNVRNYITAEES